MLNRRQLLSAIIVWIIVFVIPSNLCFIIEDTIAKEYEPLLISNQNNDYYSGNLLPLTDPVVKIYDANKIYDYKHYGFDAYDDKDDWTQVPYYTAEGYVFNGDPIIEGESFWIDFKSQDQDSMFVYAKKPDGTPSNHHIEHYRVYCPPHNGRRNYGSGTDVPKVRILKNTPQEIIAEHYTVPYQRSGDSFVTQIVTTFRVLAGRRWIEERPITQATELGMHGESRMGIFPEVGNNGNDLVCDNYELETEGWFTSPPETKMLINLQKHDGDIMYTMTWPETDMTEPPDWEPCKARFDLAEDGYTQGWPVPPESSTGWSWWCITSPFVCWDGDKIITSILNHAGIFHYEDINQTINMGGKWTSSWKAPYPGMWRVNGYVDGQYYTNEIDATTSTDMCFTSPIAGTLKYVIMYLYDRTELTPDNISTPMDIYRETILPPTIISHSPQGTEVPLNEPITVTFSKPMNHSITNNAFSITPEVSGNFNWVENTLVFEQSNSLSSGTKYNITIGTDAMDLWAEANIENPFSWEFTTQKYTLEYLAGDGQTGVVDSDLTVPLSVKVRSPTATPISDVDIIWNISAAPHGAVLQALSTNLSTTNAMGEASTTMHLGNKTGDYSISAVVPGATGSPVMFSMAALPDELHLISVTPENATVNADQDLQYSAIGMDKFSNFIELDPEWDVTNGEIDTTGYFIPQTVGHWTVYANYSGISGSTKVNVIPGELYEITVIPAETTITVDEHLELSASGYDIKGNIVPISPFWSCENGTIWPDGIYWPYAVGRWRLYANDSQFKPTVSGIAIVNITPGKIVNLVIIPGYAIVSADETFQFNISATDAKGNTIEVVPEWSAANGTIGPDGQFQPFAAGIWTVNASIANDDITATATVIVTPGKLVRIVVDPEYTQISADDDIEFEAVGLDSKGNALTNAIFQWNAVNGTISDDGEYIPYRTGTWKIYANVSRGVSGNATVIVKPGKLKVLILEPTAANLTAGQNLQFKVIGFDVKGNQIDNLSLLWSVSDTEIGVIDANGNFIAISPGETKVLAACVYSDSRVTAAAQVFINEKPKGAAQERSGSLIVIIAVIIIILVICIIVAVFIILKLRKQKPPGAEQEPGIVNKPMIKIT